MSLNDTQAGRRILDLLHVKYGNVDHSQLLEAVVLDHFSDIFPGLAGGVELKSGAQTHSDKIRGPHTSSPYLKLTPIDEDVNCEYCKGVLAGRAEEKVAQPSPSGGISSGKNDLPLASVGMMIHKASEGIGPIKPICGVEYGYNLAKLWENVTCPDCLSYKPASGAEIKEPQLVVVHNVDGTEQNPAWWCEVTEPHDFHYRLARNFRTHEMEKEWCGKPPSGEKKNESEKDEGWAPFGTHVDCPVKLEFRGKDEAGMPTEERVIADNLEKYKRGEMGLGEALQPPRRTKVEASAEIEKDQQLFVEKWFGDQYHGYGLAAQSFLNRWAAHVKSYTETVRRTLREQDEANREG